MLRISSLAIVALVASLLTGAVPKAVTDSGHSFAAEAQLLDERGRMVTLADIALGRPLAVVVIKGTYCKACTAELVRLEENARVIESLGGVVVVVSTDDPARHRTFKEDQRLSMPLLTDESGEVLRPLGFYSYANTEPTPGVFFVDRCGDVVGRFFGRRPGAPQTRFILDGLMDLARSAPTCEVL